MAGLVPAIHALLSLIGLRKSWMRGHQGVYARLRRAKPAHDEVLNASHPFLLRAVLASRHA
jgi:hypothetical protein